MFSQIKNSSKYYGTVFQLVAGVRIERVWKIESIVKRISSIDVISVLCKKKVFSRNFMEKTMDLTAAQAYWYIKQLLKLA